MTYEFHALEMLTLKLVLLCRAQLQDLHKGAEMIGHSGYNPSFGCLHGKRSAQEGRKRHILTLSLLGYLDFLLPT